MLGSPDLVLARFFFQLFCDRFHTQNICQFLEKSNIARPDFYTPLQIIYGTSLYNLRMRERERKMFYSIMQSHKGFVMWENILIIGINSTLSSRGVLGTSSGQLRYLPCTSLEEHMLWCRIWPTLPRQQISQMF